MKTQIAAIEFGTSKIVTMIAQSGGMDRLDIIGSGTVPYDGYQDGDWNTPGQMIQRVGDSIAAAELEANSKIREIYVGVPGEYVHIRSCETEVELPEGVDGLKAFEAAVEAGVAFVPGTHFYPDGGHLNTLRLNFSMSDVPTIQTGMARLAEVIAKA